VAGGSGLLTPLFLARQTKKLANPTDNGLKYTILIMRIENAQVGSNKKG
jgi:hypothetical protein